MHGMYLQIGGYSPKMKGENTQDTVQRTQKVQQAEGTKVGQLSPTWKGEESNHCRGRRELGGKGDGSKEGDHGLILCPERSVCISLQFHQQWRSVYFLHVLTNMYCYLDYLNKLSYHLQIVIFCLCPFQFVSL